MSTNPFLVVLRNIHYVLVPTTKRLTFDIIWQRPETIWMGDDDGEWWKEHNYTASNRYEVISRSRMDIQTERAWLLGAKYMDPEGQRSGSMVFSSNDKRDAAEREFHVALSEWDLHWSHKLNWPNP